MNEAQQFVMAARALKGTRWRHRGRKPWAVDCVGLVVLSARAANLRIDDAMHYGREPWEDRLRRELRERFGDPVQDAWQSGDITLICWRKGEPSHVAIIGDHPNGGLTLIHSNNLHGVVECSLSGYHRECVIEVYRPNWERQRRVD
jgi:hypothetical protein